MSEPAIEFVGGGMLDYSLDNFTIKGEPLSFDGYGYMVEPHEVWDSSPHIVVKAPNQVGKSKWAVAGSLYEADANQHSVIYYLPQDAALAKFVQQEVDPVIQASPRLRGKVYDKYTLHGRKAARVHIKGIGLHGWWHGRGAQSPLARQATPADVVILDERSKYDEDWIPEIQKRLNASKYKYVRELSVPDYVGDAIEEAYDASDQRLWFVRCGHCGHRQDLDWFQDVVAKESEVRYVLLDRTCGPAEEPEVLCRSCHRGVNRLGPGLWVPRYRDRQTRGYTMQRVISATATIRGLWTVFDEAIRTGDESAVKAFYNGDLGLGYTPKSSGLDRDTLNACRRKYLQPRSLQDGVLTGGFDVQGEYLACWVSRILRLKGERVRQAVFTGRVPWGEMDDLFRRFPMRVAVMDGAYDPTKAKELRDAQPALWLALYPAVMKETGDFLRIDEDTRSVDVNRTQSLDRSHSEFLTQHVHLPRNADLIEDLYAELEDPVRVQVEDSKGNTVSTWKKRKRDDYRHACNYDFVAAELLDRGLASAPGVVASALSRRDDAVRKLERGRRA